jgi:hypothetical protein
MMAADSAAGLIAGDLGGKVVQFSVTIILSAT